MKLQYPEKLTNQKILLYGFLSVLTLGLVPSAVKRFEPVASKSDKEFSKKQDFGFAGDIFNSLAHIANATLKVKREHDSEAKI